MRNEAEFIEKAEELVDKIEQTQTVPNINRNYCLMAIVRTLMWGANVYDITFTDVMNEVDKIRD